MVQVINYKHIAKKIISADSVSDLINCTYLVVDLLANGFTNEDNRIYVQGVASRSLPSVIVSNVLNESIRKEIAIDNERPPYVLGVYDLDYVAAHQKSWHVDIIKLQMLAEDRIVYFVGLGGQVSSGIYVLEI